MDRNQGLQGFLDSLHPSRRRLVRALLLASATPVSLLSLIGQGRAMSDLPIVEGVQVFSGDVTINGVPVQAGQLIRAGDVVRTGGGDSHVTIVIGQHAYLLRENSEIEFSFEDIAEGEASALSGSIDVVTGAMLAVFAKSNVEITTPLATIGIRGTACYVDSAEEKTYICVCYGTGDFFTARDRHFLETVTTSHHDEPRYIYPPGGTLAIEKAPVIDHTNDELRMLEALVNRRPPFDDLPPGSTNRKEY